MWAHEGRDSGHLPGAQIVDISHQVSPYAIAEGAFTDCAGVPLFSAGTVHVVVVDPGVGSARRPIVVEAAGQFSWAG
jgi:S-adenosyl-L-methionine hydrolase (adenosine-forming)